MTDSELVLYWLTLVAVLSLCTLIYRRHLFARLPLFTGYATALLTCTIALQAVYHHFGFRSLPSYYAYWSAAILITIARALAVAELCRYGLRAYHGVWALVWRALVAMAGLFLVHGMVDAWGQLNRMAIYGLTIERDVEISSVVILLAVLIVGNYYGLILEPLQKWIAVGMCVLFVIDFVNNTVLRDAFNGYLSLWFHTSSASAWTNMRSQVETANDLWNTVRTGGLMISVGIWCLALLKPLPERPPNPVMLPAEVYRRLSPALNLQLRAFNARLVELLKP